MPGFDRTGPAGGGSRTGFGRGLCGGETGKGRRVSSELGSGVGLGGRPRGGGRGRCFGGAGFRGVREEYPFQTGAAHAEAELLRAELDEARNQIAAMESRLKDLEKE